MKNVLLSLAFVLATSSLLNANSIEQSLKPRESCFEYADRMSIKIVVRLNLDLDDEYEIFAILYDECMGDNGSEMVFPE